MAALVALVPLVAARAEPAQAAELVEVTNFGDNPANARMFIYVPDRVADPAPVVVALHGCGESASAHLSRSGWRPLADQHGFILVVPQNAGSACWGENGAPSVASMVEYTKGRYRVDAGRVFAAGISAGGYMTNQMLGRYARVFAAGSAWSGTPFGCNLVTCAIGLTTHTPQEWGDLVRNANPGHTGPWPRMQIWHGTADAIVQPVNATEMMEQWTNVNGAGQTPSATESLPDGITRRDYAAGGRTVVEWFSWNAGHAINPVAAREAARFFGIDGGGPGPSTTTTSSTSTTSTTSTTTTSTTTTTVPGTCVRATNSAHVQAGRATSFLLFAWAAGSNDYLGLTFSTTSLRQTAPGTWTRVSTC